MENTKRLNNIKIRMKNLKVFLQRDSDNINSNVLIEKSNEKTNIRLDNINVRINNLKVFLHGLVENINIKKEVSVNIENNLKSHRDKVYGNIKKIYGNNEKEFELIKNENNRKIKRNNFTRSDICYIKKVISYNKNTIKKQPISIDKNRKVRYKEKMYFYANAEKETELIKNDIKIHKKCINSTIYTISSIKRDNCYNKKNLKYHTKAICNTKKEIGCIKNNNYQKKKIDANKIIRTNDNTKKEIDKLLIKLCGISERLIYTNSLLNLYRKNAHANKVKIVWGYYIAVNMKICLYETKYQLDKVSLSIKNNTPVPVKVDNTIRLQRNYVLFNRKMEMILKNFQYKHFLYPELIVNMINASKIKLVSPNKKIKSIIAIDKNGLSKVSYLCIMLK